MYRALALLVLVLAVLAIPVHLSAFALQGVIYSDLSSNLVFNRAWIKNYPLYGFWSYGPSWTNYLDCTGSTGATSGIASCDWTRVSGPSALAFGSPSGTTTTVTGVTFGQYVIQAVVHDGMGNTSTVTQTIGATNCDGNGVLIPRNASFTTIFRETICVGRNPLGLEDERHFKAVLQRNISYNVPNTYSSYSIGNPDFAATQTGTVSYTFNGTGANLGSPGTTLASDLGVTDMTVHLTSTTGLDLSSLPTTPTRIMIRGSSGYNWGPYEEIEICSKSGNDLTVCYNGRGVGDPNEPNVAAAQMWSASTAIVGQQLVVGSGTSFLSTIAPAGIGPSGPVEYSTGTVTVTAGSTALAGASTSWVTSASSLINVGDIVRVAAAHSSTPFIFVSYISAINSDGSITLTKAYPSDADTLSGKTYQVIKPRWRYQVLGFTRPSPYAGTGTIWEGSTYCEDDTHCFYNTGLVNSQYDAALLNGIGTLTGTYSFADNPQSGYVSAFGGQNFYGENLAWISFFERSGIQLAKDMADETSAPWLKWPPFAGGLRQTGSPLALGGAFNGNVAHYLLYGAPSFDDLRPWFAWGNVGASSCDSGDARDTGYQSAAIVEGAIFDQDTTSTAAPGGISWNAYWRSLVGPGTNTIYDRDNKCKRTSGGVDSNSWSDTSTFNEASFTVMATSGSPTVTGTGLDSTTWGSCTGIEQGTATVTAGQNAVTATSGTFSATAGSIMLAGRYFQFLRTGATTGIISVLWPGSSGSVSYMTAAPILTSDAGPNELAIGTGTSDPALNNQYLCILDSPTQLTLDRNFVGTTGPNFIQSNQPLEGRKQQPFMLGIKVFEMRLGCLLDGTLGTSFCTLASAAAQWLATYGFNYENQSIYYGRVGSNCESGGSIAGQIYSYTTSSSTFINKTPTCGAASWIPVLVENEQLNQEGFTGIGRWYQDNPTPTNLATAEALYCAVWCYTPWNAPGVVDNPNSVGNNLGSSNMTDAALLNGKYPGQLFGQGFASNWPAIAVSQSATPRSISPPKMLGIPGSLMAWDFRSLDFRNMVPIQPTHRAGIINIQVPGSGFAVTERVP